MRKMYCRAVNDLLNECEFLKGEGECVWSRSCQYQQRDKVQSLATTTIKEKN